jgi:hypothetical protein
MADSFSHDISINEITPIIPTELYKVIKNDFNDVLQKICQKYNINYDNVMEENTEMLAKLGYKYGIKHRNRKKLDPEKTCMGRKGDGKQCTRGRRTGSNFCKSHENNLPQGSIDQPYIKKEPKNRGRRRLNKSNDCIETFIHKIDGINYLVDKNNYVYSYNMTDPEFLGVKVNDKIVYAKDIIV